MVKKMKKSEVRKEAILEAAFQLFFERGYDATTVRMIMKEVGCEIGLFYYYFHSKEDLFDQVFDRFFENYRKDFEKLTDEAVRDPFRALTRFFEYMMIETKQFREKYAQNMHRTIRWSIREQSLIIIVPYIRRIIDILVAHGAKPALKPDVLAVMLVHGVGSFILHEDSNWFSEVKDEVRRGVNMLMGLSPETADLMFPFYGEERDIEAIVELSLARKENLQAMVDLDRKKLEEVIARKVAEHEIFVIRHCDVTVGYISFSKEKHKIECQATQENCENKGVATRLLVTAMAQFPIGTEVTLLTLPEGDPKGAKAWKLYKKFGFQKTAIKGGLQEQAMTIENPSS